MKVLKKLDDDVNIQDFVGISMQVLYAKFKVLEMDALFQPMDVALALY